LARWARWSSAPTASRSPLEVEERGAGIGGVQQRLGLLPQPVVPPDEDRLQQRRLAGEVAEDRRDAHARQAGHLLGRRGLPARTEDLLGDVEDACAVGPGAETGEPFALPGIFVLRVRDGEIVESRDYFDHLTSARVRGRLDDLVAALDQLRGQDNPSS
jgi:ketosteroid isomerase-like protein